MALQKSNQEFEKYQEEQTIIAHELSLKEIEADIKQLKQIAKND